MYISCSKSLKTITYTTIPIVAPKSNAPTINLLDTKSINGLVIILKKLKILVEYNDLIQVNMKNMIMSK